MNYAIGLDIGVASVGWAAIELDANGDPFRIIDLGSRVFQTAEHPKTGASLAAPRRDARSMRRRLRRHRHRLDRIQQAMLKAGLLSQEELDHLYNGKLPDIYALRVRALDEAVSRTEFARILLHLAQRRGFRSNKKSEEAAAEKDKEQGKLLAAVKENETLLAQYRTAGEMMLLDSRFAGHKRNQGGEYLCTLPRTAIVQEAEAVFAAQRRFGSTFAAPELEKTYLDILQSQRSFADGPGPGSPYKGSNEEFNVGLCTLEPESGEKRAPKACYSFELFSLLQALNNMRIESNRESRPLTADERQRLIALAHSTAAPSYERLRKELGLSEEDLFKGLPYGKSDPTEVEKKRKFDHLRAYHQIRKALDKVSKGRIRALSHSQLDTIGEVFTLNLEDAEAEKRLLAAGLTAYDTDALLRGLTGFRGRGHISLMACNKLNPLLEQGLSYADACAAVGYDHRAHTDTERTALLHPTQQDYANITSPVVLRAVSQTVKVINALVRKYGSPVRLNIEQARELSRTFDERRQMERDMDANRQLNEAAMEQLRKDLGIQSPTPQDLVKFKLWKMQGEVCPYTQQHLDIQKLFDPGYVDVDHIIPYSISFDDSYKNKVLVVSAANRQKGNRLPLEYLQGKAREDFIVWVNANVKDHRKRQRLLKEHLSEQEKGEFKERALQDTKAMERFLYNYIRDHLLFTSLPGYKKLNHVIAVNGAVTAELRKRWGLSKVRADGDTHHALDAVVVACTTQGMIQRISEYAAHRENRWYFSEDGSYRIDPRTGEAKETTPKPWPHFRAELEARLADDPAAALEALHLATYPPHILQQVKPVFVSRMPDHKVTGPAHKATVFSAKAADEGMIVYKARLSELKLDKDGEIADYYMPDSDRLLYNALKQQLIRYGGDAKKAFAGDFYKPKADGTPGPLVKSVKLIEKSTLNVPVQKNTGIAAHDTMVRVDVFHVEGDGYYLVPIYVADTLKRELPNKAIIAYKPYTEWKEMKEKHFIFSLYPGDLIRVTAKKSMKMALCNKESTLPKELLIKDAYLYYESCCISTGAVSVKTDRRTYKIDSLGVKTLPLIEKYQVDVLGNYTKVNRETRQTFGR
ncbi:MAG: type II CRISPR RNA-guided endonuclease Cas9 [Oscillospiraceae bacterium]|nr:type II CRISPR RNA-guided endonuclease Cas9 [Oscillospiraceae bacterium]